MFNPEQDKRRNQEEEKFDDYLSGAHDMCFSNKRGLLSCGAPFI
jgi:hypothetical protein